MFTQLHYAACFSSMCPVCRRALRQLKCLASLVVPAAHGGNFIKTFAGAETHPCLVGERSPGVGPFGEPELNRVMQGFLPVGGHRQC